MKIEKCGYSVDPWRLLDDDDREVPGFPETVDAESGRVTWCPTISGRTKQDCLNETLRLLEYFYRGRMAAK